MNLETFHKTPQLSRENDLLHWNKNQRCHLIYGRFSSFPSHRWIKPTCSQWKPGKKSRSRWDELDFQNPVKWADESTKWLTGPVGLFESESVQPKSSRCALSQQGEERRTARREKRASGTGGERRETEGGWGPTNKLLSGPRQLVENFPSAPAVRSQKQLEVERREGKKRRAAGVGRRQGEGGKKVRK